MSNNEDIRPPTSPAIRLFHERKLIEQIRDAWFGGFIGGVLAGVLFGVLLADAFIN